MSSKDDEDITRIDELPDFNPDEEDEEDIPSLETMAAEMGLEELEDATSSSIDIPIPEDDEDEGQNFQEFAASASEQGFESEADFDSEADFGDETDFNSEAEFGAETDSDQDADFGSETDFSSEAKFDSETNSDFEELDDSNSEDENLFDSPTESEIVPAEPEATTKEPEVITEEPSVAEEMPPQLTPVSDLVEIAEEKPVEIEKTPLVDKPSSDWQPSEDLAEIKDFAINQANLDYSSEGNPPFSIIIKNIQFYEDIDAILEILNDFKLVNDEENLRKNLEFGQTLIPRLSEYVAILLCHKLRQVNCDLLMGLTEEIHPPKSYDSQDRGLMTKRTLVQNKKHHFQTKDLADSSQIVASTLHQIEGHRVAKHLGVTTKTRILDSDDLQNFNIEDELINQLPLDDGHKIESLRLKRENKLASRSNPTSLANITASTPSRKPKIGLDSLYKEMIEELKEKALEERANGVIGINFVISPVSLENYLTSGPQYQILCTGNLVWIERL